MENAALQTVAENKGLTYEEEKANGIRLSNGAKRLQSLKPVHFKIISLFMDGKKNVEIARACCMTQATVSRILSDPLVEQEMASLMERQQKRLNLMSEKAVDAVEDALDHENIGMRLRGVDRYTKLKDSIGGGQEKEQTAEDVIAQIMQNIQINVNVEK